jgi:hypothetical protein
MGCRHESQSCGQDSLRNTHELKTTAKEISLHIVEIQKKYRGRRLAAKWPLQQVKFGPYRKRQWR